MSSLNYLKSIGLTNHSSEDYGVFACSKYIKPVFNYYCTSNKCCNEKIGEELVFVKKSNSYQIVPKYFKHKKVLKLKSDSLFQQCPDCSSYLFAERDK